MPHTVINESCAACGSSDGTLKTDIVDTIVMRLCVDFAGCAKRYRDGRTPGQYGKGLRSGILA